MASFKEEYAKEQENPFPNYRDLSRLLYIEVSTQFLRYDQECRKFPNDFYWQAELLVRIREVISIAMHGENKKSYAQAN
jgi:hypothetical protein